MLDLDKMNADPYWIRISIQSKMLNPDQMNADLQPRLVTFSFLYSLKSNLETL
jgi:hypothetical protein